VRRPTRRIGKLRREDVSRSLKLLCSKRNIENLSTIQEKSGYLLGQRRNERFVGKQELSTWPYSRHFVHLSMGVRCWRKAGLSATWA
jgi:hypothetical protein